jgi:hypothetical protein
MLVFIKKPVPEALEADAKQEEEVAYEVVGCGKSKKDA